MAPGEALRVLVAFLDGATSAGQLYGRVLVSPQHDAPLVLGTSQRRGSVGGGSGTWR
jgi:hypothetical protein